MPNLITPANLWLDFIFSVARLNLTERDHPQSNHGLLRSTCGKAAWLSAWTVSVAALPYFKLL
jgi:hypothetical protein